MLRARRDDDRAVSDRNHRLGRVSDREPTAGTLDAASRSVPEEVGRSPGGEATGPSELFDVLVTADERDRELVDEEKREPVPCLPASRQRGPARCTLDRWFRRQVVRLLLRCIHENCSGYDVYRTETRK